MIEIDGSFGEGGGAILRQAVALAAHAGRAVRISRIRAGREQPGMKPQHVKAVEAVAALAHFGTAQLAVSRRGYYPKGGGRLYVQLVGAVVPPGPLVLVAPGGLSGVGGVSHAARMLAPRRVAERQAEAARGALAPLGVPVEIAVEYGDAYSPGSGITLWTVATPGPSLGASALGARGKPAEDVGGEAARALQVEIASGAAVDRHLADQLIPFLAVSGGSLRTSEVTAHARSNMYVAERILGAAFEVDGDCVTARPARGDS